jgi:hypothetical protein
MVDLNRGGSISAKRVRHKDEIRNQDLFLCALRREHGQKKQKNGTTWRSKGLGWEGAMKEKSKGVKESKRVPQKSLKEKRKMKKEKKNK